LVYRLRVELYLEEPYEEMCNPLIEDVVSDEDVIRQAAAKALEKTLEVHKDNINITMMMLKEKYEAKLYVCNLYT